MKNEVVNYDDYFMDGEKLPKGFYLHETKKTYVLMFNSEEKRDAYIEQEKSRYKFTCMPFEVGIES